MDFEKIVVTAGQNKELTAAAGNILGLVLARNTRLIFNGKIFEIKPIKEGLEEFKTNLKKLELIPANSEISLGELYEKIILPLRMKITK